MCIIPELSGYDELQLCSAVGRSRAHLGCSLLPSCLPNCRLDEKGADVGMFDHDSISYSRRLPTSKDKKATVQRGPDL